MNAGNGKETLTEKDTGLLVLKEPVPTFTEFLFSYLREKYLRGYKSTTCVETKNASIQIT